MKHLIIAFVALWVFFQLAGMIWPSRDPLPDSTLSKLLEPPRRSIENPYHNGYFYLFGLTAAAPLDPAKTGYDIWVEDPDEARRADHNDNVTSRSDLGMTLSLGPTVPAWEAEEPLSDFRKDAQFQAMIDQYRVLLTRYDHLLGMPFEDWGYGQRVTPRFEVILAVHRLYIADGFSHNTPSGLDRLHKEFMFWRAVLRDATTISTKVLAQVVITDDLQLLSRLLAQPAVDKSLLTMGGQLTLPLTASEYSLRWPIQNEIALAVKGNRARSARGDGVNEQRNPAHEWLLNVAHLPLDAFNRIEHPRARSIFGLSLHTSQTLEIYAAYYEAVIRSSGTGPHTLPRMREVMETRPRGIVESLVNPQLPEPDWEIFYHQLIEIDARLRLASLQIQLRRPSAQTAAPTRLAQLGSQYFDPFTGLPMLWSPTQHKLYSVGKDRLDDGGDPTFDISVPAVIATAHSPAKAIITGSTSRRSPRS